MDSKSIISEINKQKLLSNYKDIESILKSFKTNEEMIAFFNQDANKVFLSNFFSMFKQEMLDGNFSIFYQPLVGKNSCTSAEALFRCNINGTNIYPPFAFALSNFFDFEKELNLELLNKICKDVSTFRQEIDPNFRVSFNINPELLTKDFSQSFYKTLNENSIPNNNIAIELLESSPFNNVNKQIFNEFLSNGTKIYLDDYGAGFANLETLKNFPFTHLKFSGDLVSGIDQNLTNQEVIATALEYCNQNNIKPVFEHVETKEELKTINLLTNEERIIQGYYFSKPLLPEELIEFANGQNQNEQSFDN